MISQLVYPYTTYYLDTQNGDVYSSIHPAHKGKLFKLTPNKTQKYNLYATSTKKRKRYTSIDLMKLVSHIPFTGTDSNVGKVASKVASEPPPKLPHITAASERFKQLPDSYKNFVFDTVDKNLYSLKSGTMRLLKPVSNRKEEGWQIAPEGGRYSLGFFSIDKAIELSANGVPYAVESTSTFLLTKNRVPIRTASSEHLLQDFARDEIKTFPGEYEIWERKGGMKLIPESIQYVTD